MTVSQTKFRVFPHYPQSYPQFLAKKPLKRLEIVDRNRIVTKLSTARRGAAPGSNVKKAGDNRKISLQKQRGLCIMQWVQTPGRARGNRQAQRARRWLKARKLSSAPTLSSGQRRKAAGAPVTGQESGRPKRPSSKVVPRSALRPCTGRGSAIFI